MSRTICLPAHSPHATHARHLGKGLGLEGQGIVKTVSHSNKHDTGGLGKGAEDFGFAWWDHIFNKSAASIDVVTSTQGDGVEVVKSSSQSTSSTAAKSLLYGSFVKASTSSTPAKAGIAEKANYCIKVTDKELFLACEGRTARKGARGAEATGAGKRMRTGESPIPGLVVAGAVALAPAADTDGRSAECISSKRDDTASLVADQKVRTKKRTKKSSKKASRHVEAEDEPRRRKKEKKGKEGRREA
jgi:hypothetical protein